MPWIRLSDNYVNDEKFSALGDGAFRLWHEGMSYCRHFQTDGLIPFTVMRKLPAHTKGREKELASPCREGVAPLWDLVPALGYKVHNYLAWNLSKEEEANEKSASAARMRKFRGGAPEMLRRNEPVTNGVTNGVTVGVTNAFVPDRIGKGLLKEEESEKKPHAQTAARMLDAFKGAWKVAYGVDCVIGLSPIQFARLEQCVAELGEFKFLEAVRAFFATTDPYVIQAKHSLGLLMKEPTKYLAKAPRTRPRGCQHDPACADDVSHTARASRELREQAS